MGIVQVRDDSGRWSVHDELEAFEIPNIKTVLRCPGCGIAKPLFKDEEECSGCGIPGFSKGVWVPIGCLLAAQEKAL